MYINNKACIKTSFVRYLCFRFLQLNLNLLNVGGERLAFGLQLAIGTAILNRLLLSYLFRCAHTTYTHHHWQSFHLRVTDIRIGRNNKHLIILLETTESVGPGGGRKYNFQTKNVHSNFRWKISSSRITHLC